MSRIAEALRAAREARQLDVDEVAAALQVPTRWLEDLEAGEFQAFGNEVHAQAAIRLYARELEVDVEPLLRKEDLGIPRTGETFEPRIATSATGREVMRYVVNQSLRASDATRVLAIIAGLELLAGIGMLVVRLGG